VVRIFLAIQKNKKVKTLQKLSNDVQKKNKTEQKKVYFHAESIECAHRKYEKQNIHKK